jgi:four helix bundle protein
LKADNVVQSKSYAFALRVINLYKYLKNNEYELSKQILRSGTSIGANIEEAIGAQSKKDFISKISIAYKEARETHYWIRLLCDSNYIDRKQADSLLEDCVEIQKIIGSIQRTVKHQKENNSL